MPRHGVVGTQGVLVDDRLGFGSATSCRNNFPLNRVIRKLERGYVNVAPPRSTVTAVIRRVLFVHFPRVRVAPLHAHPVLKAISAPDSHILSANRRAAAVRGDNN